MPQLEAFVPLLCTNAKPHVTTARLLSAPTSTSDSPASRARTRHTHSDASAAAAQMAAMEAWDALRAACLRALLEHLRFCARLSYVSYHLHTITFAVLECVDASGQGAPQVRVGGGGGGQKGTQAWPRAAGSILPRAAAETARVFPIAVLGCLRHELLGMLHTAPHWATTTTTPPPALFPRSALQGRYMSPRALLEQASDEGRMLDSVQSISRTSISHVVAASPPDVAALLVFEELAHMTRVGRVGGR